MVFSSITFLFYFLPVFLVIYFGISSNFYRNIFTVFASFLFYFWGEPRSIVLLVVLILANFVAAILIDGFEGRVRSTALAAAVATNVCILLLYKYANFVASTCRSIGLPIPETHIALPLGISFFVFHCISYNIDVFRRRVRANRDLSQVAMYIALFPQLVAGPIVRYKTVARQPTERIHTLGRAAVGTRIFAVGLAQKVLIADQVAATADVAFDSIRNPTAAEAAIGLIAYTLQIYNDFAGYSNMAIGLGLILGFSFPRNFNLPYTAESITDFWRRWHISLSSWLRDYLYIPLGGNRLGLAKTYRNLMTVFVLCGLWHGANWTFLFWGGWHGALLVVERLGLDRLLKSTPALVRRLYTISAVMGGWVLFRSHDLRSTGRFFGGLSGGNGWYDIRFLLHKELRADTLLALFVGGLVACAPQVWPSRYGLATIDDATFGAVTLVLLTASCIFVASGSYSPFLYFRF